jgi:hypothetical protein
MMCLLPLVLVAMAGDPSAAPAVAAAHDPVLTRPAAPADADLLRSPLRRVRAADRHAGRVLAEGMRRSRTFASLVAAVQKTDVIVYVESVHRLPAKMGGRLLLQGAAGADRYLRVQVLASLRANDAIEIVAHELRHALEVADESSVVDDAGLTTLYRRIGYSSFGGHTYDTHAARMTSHIVRREIGG